MMIGIKECAYYIPENFLSNSNAVIKFNIENKTIIDRLGIEKVSRMLIDEDTSILCVKAFESLKAKIDIDISKIDCIVCITQNPDYTIPHSSAIIHGLIGLPESCASFDISLGCSGYVYGLSIMKSFMECSNLHYGLLFTADPYSKIIDPDDYNTSMLFGDAATVTLLAEDYIYNIEKVTFGTIGKEYESLICKNSSLKMNGRSIFNFVSRHVPKNINENLYVNNIQKEDIDLFIFHQANKYMIEQLILLLQIDNKKVPIDLRSYGNTVSSSIPIILSKELDKKHSRILLCGFGVGLSWASNVLTKIY